MELKECLKKYDLELPNDSITIVDLVRTIYKRLGYNAFNEKSNSEIEEIVKDKKHVILVLVDGMGSNLITSLPDDYKLKKNKKRDLITVNPSSTGAVLTTLATGEYPAKHGIIGWYGYNREKNMAYYPVLFSSRDSGKDLGEYGLKEDQIYKYKSVMNKLAVKTCALFPEYMVNSKFSKFVLNDDSSRIGYTSIENAFDIVINGINNSKEKTFSYVYIPDIDSNEHDNGVYSSQVMETINKIEKGLSKLEVLDKNEVVTIITADHGQIDVPDGDVIMDFDKYNKYFYAMPGIDFGTATYYVKEEFFKEFEQEFKNDFNEKMFLFKTEEYLKLNIFGKEEVSEHMLQGLGEYISFCKKGYYLVNTLQKEDYVGKVKGCHSGFSKEELTIPLIVI